MYYLLLINLLLHYFNKLINVILAIYKVFKAILIFIIITKLINNYLHFFVFL